MVRQGIGAGIDVDIKQRQDLMESTAGMNTKNADQIVDILGRTVMEQERILAILNQSVADQTRRIVELTGLLHQSRTMLNELGLRYHKHEPEPSFAEIGGKRDRVEAISTSFGLSSLDAASPSGIHRIVGREVDINQSVTGEDLPTLEAMADLQGLVLTMTEENFEEVRRRIEDFPVEFRGDVFKPLFGWDLRANSWIGRIICSLPDLAVPLRQGPCTELAEAAAADDVLGVRRTLPLDAMDDRGEKLAACFPSACCSPLIGAHAPDVVRILDELPEPSSFMAVRSRRLARRWGDWHQLDLTGLTLWIAVAGPVLLDWIASRNSSPLNTGLLFRAATLRRNATLLVALLRAVDLDLAPAEFAEWPFAFRVLWGNRVFSDEALAEALRYACDPWTTRMLLAAGAEPTIERLIEVASRPLGDAETVRALSAEISARAGGTSKSPIVGSHVLCRVCGGHLVSEECVKALLEAGAGVAEVNDDGMTPLMMAAVTGRTDLVQLLLSFGADVNQRTDLGTPLHFAANADVAAALASAGASLHSCDKHGRTPLQLAIERGVLDVQREIGEMSQSG